MIINKAINFEEGLEESISPIIENMFDKIILTPDTHIGADVPIGFVAQVTDKIIPNIVGVDIGCGMSVYEIALPQKYNFRELENFITANIPSGFDVNEEKSNFDLSGISFELRNKDRILQSIGTLGGGNHFIEICRGWRNDYLVVHSGSRSLGMQVNKFHQNKLKFDSEAFEKHRNEVIENLKSQGRYREIENAVKNIDKTKFEKDYLQGEDFDLYMNDLYIAQKFASENRKEMIKKIVEYLGVGFSKTNFWESIHNYIDPRDKVVRKGATPANKGEKIVVPINMRDGIIIAEGKGNADWLNSAPHGAGRVMSRSQAFKELDLDDFKKEMENVNTFSVQESTLDEAPMAYRGINEIREACKETFNVIEVAEPIYNFKDKNIKKEF